MINELLLNGIIALVSAIIGFLVAKKLSSSRYLIYVDQAKSKANVIEKEAQKMLHKTTQKVEELEKEAQVRYNEASDLAKKDLLNREKSIYKKEQDFTRFTEKERKEISSELKRLESRSLDLSRNEKRLETLKKEYQNRLNDAIKIVQEGAGFTTEEARNFLIEQVKEQSRAELAHAVRRAESESKSELRKKANYILAQATSRFAGEFASERLISTIYLNDDELKGRIIGKEGRNIKTLASLLGVDIIIDETPNEIVVSSFNLYRRAIATKTINLLLEDGRIQPARIEEIYKKVCEEFEESTLHEGEQVLFDLGISNMHPELTTLLGKLRFRASYGQNALAHTLEVAHMAGIMASEMGADPILARRAGLLHDIGKSLTHDIEGNHVDLGVDVCRRYHEDEVIINAIYAHHGHEEIKSIECAAVCAADALSAARPGARREVLESYIKRMHDIEEIASTKEGVNQAYAINAGRELRVIVNAVLVNDDESVLLAKEIAKEIHDSVNYPGDIKVNVIRESRAIEYAH
jgi:ribonuclease Y